MVILVICCVQIGEYTLVVATQNSGLHMTAANTHTLSIIMNRWYEYMHLYYFSFWHSHITVSRGLRYFINFINACLCLCEGGYLVHPYCVCMCVYAYLQVCVHTQRDLPVIFHHKEDLLSPYAGYAIKHSGVVSYQSV